MKNIISFGNYLNEDNEYYTEVGPLGINVIKAIYFDEKELELLDKIFSINISEKYSYIYGKIKAKKFVQRINNWSYKYTEVKIYKLPDEWFYVHLDPVFEKEDVWSGTKVQRYNSKTFKCDQWDGLIMFLNYLMEK